MPGTYHIKYADPTRSGDKEISIGPIATYPPSGTQFPLAFTGYRYPEWGERMWTNILRLLENFASPTTPLGAVAGQIWVDTASGSGTPKFYGTDNVWHEIGAGITIDTVAPSNTSGLWFNPTTRALSYWSTSTLAWENIICIRYAAQFEYNELAQQLNDVYTIRAVSLPRMTLLTGSTQPSDSQWTSLIAAIRSLAQTAGISTSNITDTNFVVSTSTLSGIRYSRNAYDALIVALQALRL